MEIGLLLDPVSAAIVVGGTGLLVAVQVGPRQIANVVRHIRALLHKRFIMTEHRAALAGHVARMQSDGVIRGEAPEDCDAEFADVTAALVKHRSIDALVAEHERHALERCNRRKEAAQALCQAGELAPVMGLAGTLFALTQLPIADLAGEGALMASVSQAVLSTLYGLLLAHLVCMPLAAAITRRGVSEEEERDRLVQWLVEQLAPACPSRVATLDRDAA